MDLNTYGIFNDIFQSKINAALCAHHALMSAELEKVKEQLGEVRPARCIELHWLYFSSRIVRIVCEKHKRMVWLDIHSVGIVSELYIYSQNDEKNNV